MDPIPYPLPSLPGCQVSSVSHQLDNGTWSTECTQVSKVGLDAIDHIVRCMAIQHTGKHPISYVCHCVESFHPQGLWQSWISEHCAHRTGEYPDSVLSNAIRGRVIRDCSADLHSFSLTEPVQTLSPQLKCRSTPSHESTGNYLIMAQLTCSYSRPPWLK